MTQSSDGQPPRVLINNNNDIIDPCLFITDPVKCIKTNKTVSEIYKIVFVLKRIGFVINNTGINILGVEGIPYSLSVIPHTTILSFLF